MIARLRSVLQAFTTCLSLLAAAPPAAALFAAVLILGAMPGRAADPVVSNLKAVQRAGTKLVDITHDLETCTPQIILIDSTSKSKLFFNKKPLEKYEL